MNKKLILVTLSVIFFNLTLFCGTLSHTNQNIELERFFNYLYNFDFKEADSCANSKQNTECYRHLMQLNYKWWQLITTDNPHFISSALASINGGIESINQLNLPEHEKAFFQIYFESFRLRILLYNKQYFRAYTLSKGLTVNAHSYLGFEKQWPQFELIAGLFHCFGAAGKRKYPLLFNHKAFMRANSDSGFYFLGQAALCNQIFINTEACYFRMKILHEIENNQQQALIDATNLSIKYSRNIIFRYHEILFLLKTNRKAEAEIIYRQCIKEITNNQTLSFQQRQHLTSIINTLFSKKRK